MTNAAVASVNHESEPMPPCCMPRDRSRLKTLWMLDGAGIALPRAYGAAINALIAGDSLTEAAALDMATVMIEAQMTMLKGCLVVQRECSTF